MGDDSYVGIDPSKCAGCLQCVKNCPAKALSYEGEAKDVDEVVKVCLQDIDFYEESGGGVTISGGEGMVQPDFVKALLAKLKELGFVYVTLDMEGFRSGSMDVDAHDA